MAKTRIEHPRLGIDLGGTKIVAVVIDGKGRVRGSSKRSTKVERGYRRILERLARTAAEALEDAGIDPSSVTRVGLGVPGPVDQASGRLVMAKNLGWQDKPLATDFGKLMGMDVVLDNDVNCGARAEITYGAVRKASSAVLAFVGTGLGGAVVVDGKILPGAHGFGGELGHMPTPFSTAPCSCGRTGCLETMVSKRGIARLINEAAKGGATCRFVMPEDGKLMASDLVQAWADGCQATRQALKQSCDALAWGLAVAGSLVDPEVFVLGGGVFEALGERLVPLVAKRMPQWSFLYQAHAPRVVVAETGSHAVAVGAAILSGVQIKKG